MVSDTDQFTSGTDAIASTRQKAAQAARLKLVVTVKCNRFAKFQCPVEPS